MILPSHALANGRLHQTRQGGEDVDGRIDLPVVQLTVNVDLALGDVAGQIGDGVSDVVVRHGEDGDLGDGPVPALDAAGALVHGGQIGVHVTGETAATGHFLASSGDL